MKKKKKIPKFKSEAEERNFWLKHDVTDYVDIRSSKSVVFPNLMPSTKTISLRLPEEMIFKLKSLANRRDVPYQSLIKIYLKDRLDEELEAS